MENRGFAFRKETDLSFEEAVEKVTGELKKEGFGILTQVDVTATMKAKLDADLPKYVILGACNPSFAFKALQADHEMGILMPCNVVVHQMDSKTVVAILNPEDAMQGVDTPGVVEMAQELSLKAQKVLAGV